MDFTFIKRLLYHRQMNLFLFNDNDRAVVYGIGTYLRELTHALENSTINIHIVHLYANCRKFEIIETNQVKNWYIPEVHYDNTYMDGLQKIENYYRNVVYLLRVHIKDTHNLIFHFNFNQCQILAKELKSVFDCKTVSVIHYIKWQLEMHGNLSRLKILKSKSETDRSSDEQMTNFVYLYEKALFHDVDKVIALSQYMRHILEKEYKLNPDKISVIPNGLNETNQIQENKKRELRKKWRIPEDEFIMLFVGRLDPVKGLIYLIEAYRTVLENYPDCRLIIAGNGSYDTYLREAIDVCTKVTFTGLLTKEELHELYQMTDIGVMPSFHEQCSYVAIEMMMYGVPLIASTSTGLKEMIIDGHTGLQIPVIEHADRVEIDSSLLAEKILYLLYHPEERIKMVINARRHYEMVYSSYIFRRNMLNFYTSLFHKD